MIRRVLVFAALGVVLAALETALLAALGIHAVALHLFLGLVVYLAVHAGGIDGALGAAAVGYAWDAFAGTPTGLSVVLCVALFLGIRIASQALDAAGPVLSVLGAAAQLGYGLGAVALLALGGQLGDAHFGRILGTLGWEVLLALVVVPAVCALAGFVDRRLGGEPEGSEVLLR